MNRKENSKEFSLMIMTAFFLVSFLLLVLFSTSIYRNIAVSQEEASLSRTLSSYLHTASKMNEAGIYTEEKEGKTILTIRDGDTGFGNRIYLHEGYLVEDFARLDDELHEDSAMRIGATSQFVIEKQSESLYRIATDDGEVFITLFQGEGQ